MKTFTNIVSLLLFSVVVGFGQETMTIERFRDLVATPAANVRLVPKLADAGPVGTNATVNISLKYETGKVFTEEIAGTSKIISSNCVVFTVQSKYYKQPMSSLVMYDEKAQAIKNYGLYGETVTEATAMYDYTKKIYATTSTYGDGFMEIGAGSYSDKESSDKTLVYQHGILVMTRETKSKPN